jgi:hypothetical protein
MKTQHTREPLGRNRFLSFAAAATMAIGAAGFLAAPTAHAEFAKCYIGGPSITLTVHHGTATYTLYVGGTTGSDFSGKAVTNPYVGVEGDASGSIDGTIVDFIVTWNPQSGGGTTVFRGTIGADSIAHGTATGAAAHDNGGQPQFEPGPWDATNFRCVEAEAPAAQVPAAQPKQGPTVKPNPGIGGVTFHVTDRSGVASQCTYSSEGFTSDSFSLPANGSFDLFVVAVPLFKNRTGTVTCDNGTSANTSVFY